MQTFDLSKYFKQITLSGTKIIVDAISYLLILLFLYAGISKLAIYEIFKGQMMESPLIPRVLIPMLAWFVPLLEIGIAWLLLFDKTKKTGLYMSYFMMLTFSLYLILLLIFAENAPCACGGILGSLGYTEHIIFNVVFTLMALYGIIKVDTSKSK